MDSVMSHFLIFMDYESVNVGTHCTKILHTTQMNF